MPRRPLPVFVLSVGLALLTFTALRPLFAQPAPPPSPSPASDDPAHFPKVELHPLSGSSAIGKLRLSSITLKTEIGSTTIGMDHVKRITFATDPEGKSPDTVQLADKSIVRGR